MTVSDSITTPSADPKEVIAQLNSFLRGEIAASETYRMAIDKLASSNVASQGYAGLLGTLQSDHSRASDQLRDRVRELGGETADSSGAWGAWANAVQGTMNLFGDVSALKSLKEGEEHGLKDYESGLAVLDAASQQLVENQLIPAQRRHLEVLNQLISTVAKG